MQQIQEGVKTRAETLHPHASPLSACSKSLTLPVDDPSFLDHRSRIYSIDEVASVGVGDPSGGLSSTSRKNVAAIEASTFTTPDLNSRWSIEFLNLSAGSTNAIAPSQIPRPYTSVIVSAAVA